MNAIAQTIDGIQEVLGICPCCGEVFRLVEGKFVFPQKKPRTCEFSELVVLENRVAGDDERLSVAEERFKERLERQREELTKKGRRLAKKRLKKIDPVFSGRDIDPQEVKVIFDPVEYIIFHGLKSYEGTHVVEFVSREPSSKDQEQVVASIDNSIRKGDVEFETLHLRGDGSFEVRKT